MYSPSNVAYWVALMTLVFCSVLGLLPFLLKKEQTTRTNYVCPPEMIMAIDGNSQYICVIKPKIKESQ